MQQLKTEHHLSLSRSKSLVNYPKRTREIQCPTKAPECGKFSESIQGPPKWNNSAQRTWKSKVPRLGPKLKINRLSETSKHQETKRVWQPAFKSTPLAMTTTIPKRNKITGRKNRKGHRNYHHRKQGRRRRRRRRRKGKVDKKKEWKMSHDEHLVITNMVTPNQSHVNNYQGGWTERMDQFLVGTVPY